MTDLLNSIATQGGVEGIEVKTENNPIGTVEVGSLYALNFIYTLNNILVLYSRIESTESTLKCELLSFVFCDQP